MKETRVINHCLSLFEFLQWRKVNQQSKPQRRVSDELEKRSFFNTLMLSEKWITLWEVWRNRAKTKPLYSNKRSDLHIDLHGANEKPAHIKVELYHGSNRIDELGNVKNQWQLPVRDVINNRTKGFILPPHTLEALGFYFRKNNRNTSFP